MLASSLRFLLRVILILLSSSSSSFSTSSVGILTLAAQYLHRSVSWLSHQLLRAASGLSATLWPATLLYF